jgi:hypothetical protein
MDSFSLQKKKKTLSDTIVQNNFNAKIFKKSEEARAFQSTNIFSENSKENMLIFKKKLLTNCKRDEFIKETKLYMCLVYLKKKKTYASQK